MSDNNPITENLKSRATVITASIAVVEDSQQVTVIWNAIEREVLPLARWYERV
jgi:hypothetical protein